jgi:hypothetical protein
MVMSLGEDHTVGTRPGLPRRAPPSRPMTMLGMMVDRISRSRYWKETAISSSRMRRAGRLGSRRRPPHGCSVVSPYTKRKHVDSTLYTTSSMLRTIELLLGLPPMTQYDAAATPMYASFSDKADLNPYEHVKPLFDISQVNTALAWGAGVKASRWIFRIRSNANVRAERDRLKKREGC